MEQQKKPALFVRIMQEKCPKCGQSHVFEKSEYFLQFPKMKENCENCDYRFDREPGYFLGAMYLSYGLAVLQGLTTFLICYFFFPTLETLSMLFIIMGVIILFSYKNYRLARVIYMHIFPW
jgi:uncharacterized protein (DUF983 family)